MHSPEHVVVKRLRALEIASFSGSRFFGEGLKGCVYRHKLLGTKKARRILLPRRVSSFLAADDQITQLDRLAAIASARIQHTDFIAVIAVLNFVPPDRDIDLLCRDRLKRVGLRKRDPESRLALDFRQPYAIDELKFIGTLNDLGFIGGRNCQCGERNK